jgi:hypothetical protein
MAEKIVKYFEFAQSRGGVALKVKLAMKSTITSVTASSFPDSADNIQRIRSALAELLPGENIPEF